MNSLEAPTVATDDLSPSDVVALSQELASLERLANVGELAGQLVHEFTEFLNVLLLQLSTLEIQLPRDHRDDLATIRRHGQRVTSLVNRFRTYRRGRVAPSHPVDLNRALGAVAARLEEENDWGVRLLIEARAAAPLVTGTAADVRRLVGFLVGNALSAAAVKAGEVRAATESDGKHVRLIVEDTGPAVAEADLPYLFHPGRESRPGVDMLELAACASLARRLGASLRAERLPSAGLRVVAEFSGVAR